MRALALADESPRPELAHLLSKHRPDVVVLLGDLRPDDLEGLYRWQGPKLGVHGNHDPDDGLFQALGIEDLHGRCVEIDGLRFGGIEGCRRYRDGAPYEHTDREVQKVLKKLGAVDVVLTHAPPAGVNDEPGTRVHAGWPALRDYVDRHEPRMLLHGHTYPAIPVEAVGATEIRYVRGWRVVNLPA
jgi:uncharacterized protein